MSKGCRGEKFWWSGVYSSGVPLRNHLREFWWNWILPGSTKKLSQRILVEVILPGLHQETSSGNPGGAGFFRGSTKKPSQGILVEHILPRNSTKKSPREMLVEHFRQEQPLRIDQVHFLVEPPVPKAPLRILSSYSWWKDPAPTKALIQKMARSGLRFRPPFGRKHNLKGAVTHLQDIPWICAAASASISALCVRQRRHISQFP